MATDPAPRPASFADELARRRLEHRARRLEHVIAVLRTREARLRPARPASSSPLGSALAGFTDELATVQRRLGA